MIQIIPCISVIGNKIARVSSTDAKGITFYEDVPLETALRFEDHGITRLHLLDLEGAQLGCVKNTHILESLAASTSMVIDYGGGINFDEDIRAAFAYGADMINAASVAVSNRDLFSSWLISFGRGKIILSIDVTDEIVHTRGWATKSDIKLMEMIDYFHNQGVYYVKCSDITKDGTLTGPSFDLYKKILKTFPDICLIASGGVQSVSDIKKLDDIGVHGVIFAKAYYEGKIKLKELEKFIAKA